MTHVLNVPLDILSMEGLVLLARKIISSVTSALTPPSVRSVQKDITLIRLAFASDV